MRVLFTGKGSAGSWKIRGEQLSKELGASVTMGHHLDLSSGFDHVVVVKKPPVVGKLERGFVYDIVDAWPQPQGNQWDKDRLVKHIHASPLWKNSKAVIAATDKMASDLDDGKKDIFTLYHHYRPEIKKNPIRERVKVVGYEGSPKYLGKWGKLIGLECQKRGWVFMINPMDITQCDILVAFRDFPHKGYATDNWKSNVKLANAQGSGTPIICNRESGYMETARGGAYFADTPDEFIRALDILTHQGERLSKANRLYNCRYSAQAAGEDLKSFLASL